MPAHTLHTHKTPHTHTMCKFRHIKVETHMLVLWEQTVFILCVSSLQGKAYGQMLLDLKLNGLPDLKSLVDWERGRRSELMRETIKHLTTRNEKGKRRKLPVRLLKDISPQQKHRRIISASCTRCFYVLVTLETQRKTWRAQRYCNSSFIFNRVHFIHADHSYWYKHNLHDIMRFGNRFTLQTKSEPSGIKEKYFNKLPQEAPQHPQ